MLLKKNISQQLMLSVFFLECLSLHRHLLKNYRDVLCDFMYLTDLCSFNVVQIQCCSHSVLTLWCQMLYVPYSVMLTTQNIISYLLLFSPHGNSSLLQIITHTEFWSQRIKKQAGNVHNITVTCSLFCLRRTV